MTFVAAMTSNDSLMETSEIGGKKMHQLQYAVQLCWAAHKKLVPTLHYSIVTQTPNIVVQEKSIHQSWITPASVSMPPGLGPSDATM
jgi:hypothetical protein